MASSVDSKDPGKSGAVKDEVDDSERKHRVEEAWMKMNNGIPPKMPKPQMKHTGPAAKQKANHVTPNWMTVLGFSSKKTVSTGQHNVRHTNDENARNVLTEDAKKLAADALAAVRASTPTAAAGIGKVEISEVRDFAGEKIEVKKLVDVGSEAAEKAKAATAAVPTALDSVLEQITKKPKLSVLDKTKKDWGEFKDDNKGVEQELDAYKKSSNQYLDKVSFLQRADYREFERERDVRLTLQAKRRSSDMKDDDL